MKNYLLIYYQRKKRTLVNARSIMFQIALHDVKASYRIKDIFVLYDASVVFEQSIMCLIKSLPIWYFFHPKMIVAIYLRDSIKFTNKLKMQRK